MFVFKVSRLNSDNFVGLERIASASPVNFGPICVSAVLVEKRMRK